MQILIATLLPVLINAFGSVMGKSVSAFNALPRDERRAKLTAGLRSKWLLTSPPAALAARQIAKSPTGLNMLLDALESHGGAGVAAVTDAAHAAHAAAAKHAPTSNPHRSGGRMARVRSFPSIPTLALDRLDVTRARRNGAPYLTGGFHLSRDGFTSRESAMHYAQGENMASQRSHGVTYKVKIVKDDAGYSVYFGPIFDASKANPRRNGGYSRRRNCGGDCACAPCQAARTNPLSVVGGAGPFPEGMAVRHPGVKAMARLKAAINRIDIARTSAEAHRAYGQARNVYESLKRAGVYVEPELVNDIGFSYTEKLRSIPPTPEELLEAEKARVYAAGRKRGARKNGKADYYAIVVDTAGNEHMVGPMSLLAAKDRIRALESKGMPDGRGGLRPLKHGAGHVRSAQAVQSTALLKYRNPAARRNHHIRVGGTFYTPGGRKGTVLAEARGGHYRVRWSDGTLGTVQDSEMAAYPTAGSRANGARKNGRADIAEYEAWKRRHAAEQSARATTAAGKLAVQYGGEPTDSGRMASGAESGHTLDMRPLGQRIYFGTAAWRVADLPPSLYYDAPTYEGREAIAAYILANRIPPYGRRNGARKNGYMIPAWVSPATAKKGDRIVWVKPHADGGFTVLFGFADADDNGAFEFRVTRVKGSKFYTTKAGADRAASLWLAQGK